MFVHKGLLDRTPLNAVACAIALHCEIGGMYHGLQRGFQLSGTPDHIGLPVPHEREKSHTKITVKELSERCAIARTTFYLFFEDTYDLLERLEQYLLGELVLYRPLMNGSTTRLQSSGVAGKTL